MRGVTRIAVAAFLVILVTVVFGVKIFGSGSFHDRTDEEACLVCHERVPEKGSDPYKEGNFKYQGNVEKICAKCHSTYKHTHPIKLVVTPLMKEREELLFRKNGEITCVTCHDVMERIAVHVKKKPRGSGLCLSCHVDSDIFAQIIWYPTQLRRGETGRLEVKVVEFNARRDKEYLGNEVFLYFYAKDADTGDITFGTNILYDDGTHGDRVKGDSIYTLTERATFGGEKKLVYTGWILDREGRRSNTVNLAIHYVD